MKLSLLACSAMVAVGAVPAVATTTASAALAAPAPRIAAPGAYPAVPAPVPHRHGGTVTGGTVTGRTSAGGTRLWLARYGHPPNSVGYAQSVGASPDGSQVFVAGSGAGAAAVAYDAATGAQHWASPTGLSNGGFLGVSPDGSRVFVTGTSKNGNGLLRITTRAFDAATGAVQWTAIYHGQGTVNDAPQALAVSPDGWRVFVTGTTTDVNGIPRYITVAFDASTGARRWAASYSVQHLSARAAAVAVSPLGTQVFVTGGSAGPTGQASFATVSYDAATGARQWVARYTAAPGRASGAAAVAVSPDGSTVYVAGTARVRQGQASPQNMAAVAYTTATGTKRWVALYPGTANPQDFGVATVAMALSPDGSGVFVTGQGNAHGTTNYTTVAFEAASGAQRWAGQAPLNGFGLPRGIAVDPSGTEVFVTGYTTAGLAPSGATGYATVAYDSATGAERWTRLYPGPVAGFSEATGVAVSPDGSRVFVTGGATGPDPHTEINYTTLAYSP
jgi:DNA-binding beta-propeller fold protein YncE